MSDSKARSSAGASASASECGEPVAKRPRSWSDASDDTHAESSTRFQLWYGEEDGAGGGDEACILTGKSQ